MVVLTPISLLSRVVGGGGMGAEVMAGAQGAGEQLARTEPQSTQDALPFRPPPGPRAAPPPGRAPGARAGARVLRAPRRRRQPSRLPVFHHHPGALAQRFANAPQHRPRSQRAAALCARPPKGATPSPSQLRPPPATPPLFPVYKRPLEECFFSSLRELEPQRAQQLAAGEPQATQTLKTHFSVGGRGQGAGGQRFRPQAGVVPPRPGPSGSWALPPPWLLPLLTPPRLPPQGLITDDPDDDTWRMMVGAARSRQHALSLRGDSCSGQQARPPCLNPAHPTPHPAPLPRMHTPKALMLVVSTVRSWQWVSMGPFGIVLAPLAQFLSIRYVIGRPWPAAALTAASFLHPAAAPLVMGGVEVWATSRAIGRSSIRAFLARAVPSSRRAAFVRCSAAGLWRRRGAQRPARPRPAPFGSPSIRPPPRPSPPLPAGLSRSPSCYTFCCPRSSCGCASGRSARCWGRSPCSPRPRSARAACTTSRRARRPRRRRPRARRGPPSCEPSNQYPLLSYPAASG
jgi:hypothetical protein